MNLSSGKVTLVCLALILHKSVPLNSGRLNSEFSASGVNLVVTVLEDGVLTIREVKMASIQRLGATSNRKDANLDPVQARKTTWQQILGAISRSLQIILRRFFIISYKTNAEQKTELIAYEGPVEGI